MASVPGNKGLGLSLVRSWTVALPLHPRTLALSISVRDPSLKPLGRASLR